MEKFDNRRVMELEDKNVWIRRNKKTRVAKKKRSITNLKILE